MKQPILGGGTREDRIQSLQAMVGAVGTIRDPGEVLVQAGELLRRSGVMNMDLGGVDAALRALTSAGVLGYLQTVAVEELPVQLRRAADEAVEAALADDPEERELFGASALDALFARDRAESVRVALARYLALAGPDTAAELTAAFTKFRQGLAEVDLRLRGKGRLLTPLNARRRVERDLLDPAHREEAWWFSGRSDCDALLRMLSGDEPRTSAHVDACADCRRDLDRAGAVETKPKARHLTPDDAWRLELGQVTADEKRVFQQHAEDCLECAQVMWAMAEGEKALQELEAAEAREEAGTETGRPFAGRSAGRTAAKAARTHREIARREAYRVIVVRAERVRVLVQPNRGRGLALAVLSLPPQRNVYQPKQTQEGLEFDLGAPEDVDGRTAKLTVRVHEGGESETLEVPLSQ